MSFFEIFSPGLRHQREERDRLKTLIARPNHGAGGPLGIDLDRGKATIPMPVRPAVDQAEAADGGLADRPDDPNQPAPSG